MAARKRASPKRSGATSTSPQEPSASAASTESASPGGQRGVEHARRAVPRRCQRIALVAHQRDERRDHDRQPVEGEARELVAERLARARGHHDERVASREGRLDGLLLPGAKRLVPEQAVQMCGRVHPGNLATGVDAHPRGACRACGGGLGPRAATAGAATGGCGAFTGRKPRRPKKAITAPVSAISEPTVIAVVTPSMKA